ASSGNSVTLIVLIVSQPVVDATVSIIVDGPSNTCPSNVYGNSDAHTSRFTSVVNNGSSVTVIVRIVSQPPVVDATVSVMVDGASNTWPSNVYGNSLAHTSISTAAVNNSSRATGIVLIVSQTPVVDATGPVMVDGASNTWPSNVYENSLAHTAISTVAVNNGSSVTVIVLIVSQPPVVDATVSVMVDGASNTCPSNVYGNSLAHTSRLTSAVSNGSSVTVIVRIVSQPAVDPTVSIIVDGPSNTCPSNV